jgi:L-lysine exporter family protein LysE/ArgO
MNKGSFGVALAGFGFSLSLIIAIGVQNAFVLRQGIRREHVLPIVLFCAVSDATLISAGIFGLGQLLELVPWLMSVVRWAGVAFLVAYALFAVRRAMKPEALIPDDAGASAPSLRSTMLAIAAITWLNPHVYLDTVVLMGSVANSYHADRWIFGLGAASASLVWFFALGYGARWLRPIFRKPSAWRVLDLVIAATMLAIAASLAFADPTAGH